MKVATLTPVRAEILRFIVAHHTDHGYAPSIRQIARSAGLSSSQTVHGHLRVLMDAGLITRVAGQPRTLRVVKPDEITPGPIRSIAPDRASVDAAADVCCSGPGNTTESALDRFGRCDRDSGILRSPDVMCFDEAHDALLESGQLCPAIAHCNAASPHDGCEKRVTAALELIRYADAEKVVTERDAWRSWPEQIVWSWA